ncbi:MAG TPA: M50 family metallopeptidase [Chloroflexota bacterium]|nr:M50 family metallopeptidase [Chloroflexota bacterium]
MPEMNVWILLALPGVVIHELGHYLFCRLVGTNVQEVVFFQRADASGYVVHSVPKMLRQHAVIVCGPLILNSILAFLLFRAVASGADSAFVDLQNGDFLSTGQLALATFLGISIALQAIPSPADARSLWNVTHDRLQHGHLLALLAIPFAAALVGVNHLRRYWIDWLYLVGLAILALRFPSG